MENDDYYNRMVEAAHLRMDKIERRIKHRYQAPTVPQYDLQAAPTGPSVVAVIAGQWTGVGSRAAIIYDDLTTAIATDSSYSSNFGYAVAYNGTTWVVACDNDFLYSSDGVNYSNVAVPNGASAFEVVWCSTINKFVAGISDLGGFIATSPDGSTWTQHSTPWDVAGFGFINGISESTDLGIILALGSDSNNGHTIMTSTDGSTWTDTTYLANSNELYRGVWVSSLGLWVVVGPSGDGDGIYSSPDGTTWTGRFTGGVFKDVAWSPTDSLFIAAADTTSPAMRSSSNGTSWTTLISQAASGNIAWSPTLGAFITTRGNHWYTSSDGSTWTDQGALDSTGSTGARLFAK